MALAPQSPCRQRRREGCSKQKPLACQVLHTVPCNPFGGQFWRGGRFAWHARAEGGHLLCWVVEKDFNTMFREQERHHAAHVSDTDHANL
jgi:hypothetical protein